MDLSYSDKKFLETAVSPPMVANAFSLPDGETLTSLTDTIMSYLCNGIFQASHISLKKHKMKFEEIETQRV